MGEERLKYVDIIVPRAWLYSANWSDPSNQQAGRGREFIKKAREGGKQIGWYVSGTPVGKAGLNWYVEYPPMRARLMAGVAAVKQASDALLYYRIDGWDAYAGTGGIQVPTGGEVIPMPSAWFESGVTTARHRGA